MEKLKNFLKHPFSKIRGRDEKLVGEPSMTQGDKADVATLSEGERQGTFKWIATQRDLQQIETDGVPLSLETLMTRAYERANEAVGLDYSMFYERAEAAYADSIILLQQVIFAQPDAVNRARAILLVSNLQICRS